MDKPLHHMPVLWIQGIGAEIPVPLLYLVVGNLSAGTSLFVVDRSLGSEELFARVYITRFTKALFKERCVAGVEGQRADAVFETRWGRYARFISGEYLVVFNFSRSI